MQAKETFTRYNSSLFRSCVVSYLRNVLFIYKQYATRPQAGRQTEVVGPAAEAAERPHH